MWVTYVCAGVSPLESGLALLYEVMIVLLGASEKMIYMKDYNICEFLFFESPNPSDEFGLMQRDTPRIQVPGYCYWQGLSAQLFNFRM